MTMAIEWSAEEILQMAVQIEKNGAAFYLGLADGAVNEEMKRLTTYLAEEEKKHLVTFQALSGALGTEKLKTAYELKYAEEGQLYL